jgi:hypothetical protein
LFTENWKLRAVPTIIVASSAVFGSVRLAHSPARSVLIIALAALGSQFGDRRFCVFVRFVGLRRRRLVVGVRGVG